MVLRRLMALLMTVMLVMMSAAPALALDDVGQFKLGNAGNKANDGPDAN